MLFIFFGLKIQPKMPRSIPKKYVEKRQINIAKINAPCEEMKVENNVWKLYSAPPDAPGIGMIAINMIIIIFICVT